MDFSANVARFVDGISTFVTGFTIVFATLVLLIFIIQFISKMVAVIENTGKKDEVVITSQPAVVQVTEPVSSPKTDDFELVAVITAALAASMGTTSDKLQVKSLRKIERRVR